MTNTRGGRESEKRIHEMREEYPMDYIEILHVPECAMIADHEYYWANLEMQNRVEDLMRKGWTLVPSDRLPTKALDPLKRQKYGEYIVRGESILMERPEYLGKQQEQAYNARRAAKMRSLRGVINDAGYYHTPVKAINSFH